MDAINQLSNHGTEFMNSKRAIFMSLNVCLQCLSLIFLIVGMSAWSRDEDTVEDTYWTYTEVASDNDLASYYGLRSFNLNDNDPLGHVTYDDCDNADWCDHCSTAGKTALAMCLLAFFCLCVLVVITGVRVIKALDNKWLKVLSIFMTGSVLFWTIVAVWNWQSSCVARLPIVENTTGYKNGPGYNCVVCNIFWMLFALYVHVSTSSTIAGETSEPLNDQDETEGGSQSQVQEQDQDGYVPFGDEKKNEI